MQWFFWINVEISITWKSSSKIVTLALGLLKWSELWCTLIKYAKPRATLKLEFVFCSFEKLITTVSHIGIYHWKKIIIVRHCNLPVFELGHDLQNFYFFTFIISWYHTLMWVYKLFFVVFFLAIPGTCTCNYYSPVKQ